MQKIVPVHDRIRDRGRGLQFYAGAYGAVDFDTAVCEDDPYKNLYAFSEAMVRGLAQEAGVEIVPFTRSRLSWVSAVTSLADGDIDLILDPIFLTPSRVRRELDVVQYGVVDEFCLVAWKQSCAVEIFGDGGNASINAFLSRPELEIGVLESTAATEEIEEWMSPRKFRGRWFPMPLGDLVQWFCYEHLGDDASDNARAQAEVALRKRVVVCDIGVYEYLRAWLCPRPKLVKRYGQPVVWYFPFRNLKEEFAKRQGLPAGIAYRRDDPSWGQAIYNVLFRDILQGNSYPEKREFLEKIGIRPFSIDELRPPMSLLVDPHGNPIEGIEEARRNHILPSPSDPNRMNFIGYLNEEDYLLRTYQGQYAAYYGGARIAVSESAEEAYEEARSLIPEGIILRQHILPRENVESAKLRVRRSG